MKQSALVVAKRRLAGLAALLVAAALVLSACGDSDSNDSAGEGTSGGDSDFKLCYAVDSGGINDGQYYEVAYNALKDLGDELGFELTYLTAGGAQDYVPMISTFVDGGDCSLIFALGSPFAPAVEEAAKANPEQRFLMVDAAFTNAAGEAVTYDNVTNVTFKNREASFIPGYISAGATKTGTVGVWGGQPNPQVLDHLYGFEAGVKEYNNEHGTDVKVIGFNGETGEGSMTGSFADQQGGYNMTQQQIKDGADIIFSAGGQSDLGKVAAATDNPGTLIVWVVNDACEAEDLADTACPIQLTSSLVNLDVPITQVVKEAFNDDWSPGLRAFGLAEGAVGPAPVHEVEWPDGMDDEIKTLTEKVSSGEIVVPAAPGA